MCSTIGATTIPWATRSVITSVVSDPPGRRHLGRARLGGEGVGVGVDRPRVRDVPVADRAAVAGQVVEQRHRQVERRHPQPHRPGHPPEQVDGAAAGSASVGPGEVGEVRLASCRRPPGGAPRRGAGRSAARSRGGRRRRVRPASWRRRAAGTVADVLTTTRSPGPQPRGEVAGGGVPAAAGRRSTPACARRRAGRASAPAARSPRARAGAKSTNVGRS